MKLLLLLCAFENESDCDPVSHTLTLMGKKNEGKAKM